MATRKNDDSATPQSRDSHDDLGAAAADRVLGPNPFVGLRGRDVVVGASELAIAAARNPSLLLEQEAALIRELTAILIGKSDVVPEASDKRFQEPAWTSNPLYRAVLQGHLAWSRALGQLVERSGLSGSARERAQFVVSMLTSAAAPTNTLLGNPGALKRLIDTGGANVVSGVLNMLKDVAMNGGMPAQVDTGAFKVGKNLALTPGAVVFRNEVLELIQYSPATESVHARPHLLVPPQINKFYVYDLAPGRSVAEFLVKNGFQVFMVSWRNPKAAQRGWDFDTYVKALIEAIVAIRDISGSDDVNVHGACSGAMTISALLGHLAASNQPLVHAATLMVAVLDSRAESQLGHFIDADTIALAKKGSAAKGVLEGREMGRVFAWMRPNDLIWNYWVNNYLMGNAPPVFDILYWNNDTTRLPAAFHGRLLDIYANNLLTTPSAMTVLGTPIDLSKVTCDKYLLAGTTDHITPWQGVFNTSKAFGGANEFVLSSSGHIQSIINPPGNAKAKFLTGSQSAEAADEWLAGASSNAGSWWGHWAEWLEARSGPKREATEKLGSTNYPKLDTAPGRYVVEG
ncbi:alpha/beta fold hydrolase [Burkholderia cepacia]|uniref:alpha/beta fold hydrolase n=1 Tax=Burkholderia cepacia TaxID=292 RepID=UPI002ABD5D48|nr:alpha/beta fold hydrolase [Burkholderia cepacia]